MQNCHATTCLRVSLFFVFFSPPWSSHYCELSWWKRAVITSWERYARNVAQLYMSGERFADVAMPFHVSVDCGLAMSKRRKRREQIGCTGRIWEPQKHLRKLLPDWSEIVHALQAWEPQKHLRKLLPEWSEIVHTLQAWEPQKHLRKLLPEWSEIVHTLQAWEPQKHLRKLLPEWSEIVHTLQAWEPHCNVCTISLQSGSSFLRCFWGSQIRPVQPICSLLFLRLEIASPQSTLTWKGIATSANRSPDMYSCATLRAYLSQLVITARFHQDNSQ